MKFAILTQPFHHRLTAAQDLLEHPLSVLTRSEVQCLGRQPVELGQVRRFPVGDAALIENMLTTSGAYSTRANREALSAA